jgi:hypothetical protein
MIDHAQTAISGHGNAPLTKTQRQTLAMLARQAYDLLSGHGVIDTGFDAWRHAECIKACNFRITEAANRHYLAISAHFYNLMGKSGVAFKKVLKAQTESHQWAMTKLKQECQEAGVSLSYPRAIAINKYKTGDLDSLTDKQLWHLTFNVRRRAQKNHAHKNGGQKGATVAATVIARLKVRNSSNPF